MKRDEALIERLYAYAVSDRTRSSTDLVRVETARAELSEHLTFLRDTAIWARYRLYLNERGRPP